MAYVKKFLLLVALAIGMFLHKSCKIDRDPSTPSLQKPFSPRRVLSDEPPVTEEEAERFANELERTFAEEDQTKAEGIIRLNELIERCISDLNPPAAIITEIRRTNSDGFANIVIRQLSDGAEYKFVRNKIVEGRPRPLFRLLGPEGGVDYHEFVLARDTNGKIAVKDIYVALSGEYATNTIRLSLLPQIKRANSHLTILTKAERDYLDNLPTISAMNDAIKSNSNYAAALAGFRNLPVDVQKIKSVQIAAIQIAMKIDESEYIAELKRFRENHFIDPDCDVMGVAYYLIRRDFERAITCIERLQVWTGGDPYLRDVKAAIIAELNQKQK